MKFLGSASLLNHLHICHYKLTKQNNESIIILFSILFVSIHHRFVISAIYIYISGADPEWAHPARAPPKIGKNMIFWRKIVIFHTKYPKYFRASLRSAQIFLSAPPPLTWNPGSAPVYSNRISFMYFFNVTNCNLEKTS